MTKSDWKIKFREFWPNATERRVPIGETPEEVIFEIDPSLEYTGRTAGYSGNGNYLYLVRDPSDGLEKVLKIAGAPAGINNARHEHEIFHRLNENNVVGIPMVSRYYNSIDSQYDPEKFIAMLREYVDAEEFDVQLRGSDTYKRLEKLAKDINGSGVSFPRDFKGANIMIDKKGQPYFIDFEESVIADNPFWDKQENYRKMNILFRGNVQINLEKSNKLLKRLLSKSPGAANIIARLFYEGPVKPTSYGW